MCVWIWPRPAANGQQTRGAKFLHFRQTTFKNKIGRRIKKDALRTKEDKRDPFFRVGIFRVFRASLHQASHRGRQPLRLGAARKELAEAGGSEREIGREGGGRLKTPY